MKLSDMEIDLLIDRFDKDGDGELDLDEFKMFINEEINLKTATSTINKSISPDENITQERNNNRSTRRNDTNKNYNNTNQMRVNDETQANNMIEPPPEYIDEDDNDRTAEMRLSFHNNRNNNQLTNTNETSIAEYALSGSTRLSDVINPVQLTEIFAQQAKIEAKLGPKYFKYNM
jgi:hypothetical protein